MNEQPMTPGYLFGQGGLAALRLEKLGEIFDPATEEFLASIDLPADIGSAIDLGCGTGLTTMMLASRFPAVTGLDVADEFLELAANRRVRGARFVHHDTTQMPLPGAPADLVFCRFLLTHLTSPMAALSSWQTQLRSGGVFAAQEVEAIDTESEPIAAYLGLLEHVLNARQHKLYIGGSLGAHDFGGWRIRTNDVRVHSVDGRRAAEMFSINLRVWRTAPEIATYRTERELDELEQALRRKASGMADQNDVVWRLREIVLEKP